MPRATSDVTRESRFLWEQNLTWQQMPDDVRQQALDVLSAMILNSVYHQNTTPNLESITDDHSSHD